VKSSAVPILLLFLLLPACAFAANSVVNMSHYDLMRQPPELSSRFLSVYLRYARVFEQPLPRARNEQLEVTAA